MVDVGYEDTLRSVKVQIGSEKTVSAVRAQAGFVSFAFPKAVHLTHSVGKSGAPLWRQKSYSSSSIV